MNSDDESGIDECLHREYGYAHREEKAIKSIYGKIKRQILLLLKLLIESLHP